MKTRDEDGIVVDGEWDDAKRNALRSCALVFAAVVIIAFALIAVGVALW